MGDPTSRRKAYRLKGTVTRDTFLTWDMNHRSYCRQFPDWLAFLPTGTRPTWKSFTEDPTRGISITKVGPAPDRLVTEDETETNKVRNALEEFLVTLGTYCPENFMFTVVQESTSYEWVLKRIQETYNLNTKGVRFLAGCGLKSGDSDEPQTHQQRYQAVREWSCSSLLKKGDMFKGKALDKDEVLTPFGENIIVEKWLDGTHDQLKGHIMQTRGSLFTEERPNLSDNQRQICEQMDVLLQEIELKEKHPSINRTGFAPPSRQPRTTYTPRPSYPVRAVYRPAHSGAGQTGGRAGCPPNMCRRCYEAGRHGPASRTHFANEEAKPKDENPHGPHTGSCQEQPRVQQLQPEPGCCLSELSADPGDWDH